MKRNRKRQKREGQAFPIASSIALKVALEDAETSHFIRKNFSEPEQRPKITTHKKIFQKDQRFIWIVEIIEKIPHAFNGKNRMLNIARIEVDSFNGKIINRRYFRNIFDGEYRRAVSLAKS